MTEQPGVRVGQVVPLGELIVCPPNKDLTTIIGERTPYPTSAPQNCDSGIMEDDSTIASLVLFSLMSGF